MGHPGKVDHAIKETRILLETEAKNGQNLGMPKGGCFSRTPNDLEKYIDSKIE